MSVSPSPAELGIWWHAVAKRRPPFVRLATFLLWQVKGSTAQHALVWSRAIVGIVEEDCEATASLTAIEHAAFSAGTQKVPCCGSDLPGHSFAVGSELGIHAEPLQCGIPARRAALQPFA